MRWLPPATLAAMLILTPAVAAQDFALKVTRTPANTIGVTVGDLRGQPIPPTVTAALAFVIRWGRGKPDPGVPLFASGSRPMGLTDTTVLQLPAVGWHVLRTTDHLAHVQVQQCTLLPTGQPPVPCPMTLELTRPAASAPWRVTTVRLP